MNIQDWFPLGWTGWIFLHSKWLSRVFSSTTDQKHQFFSPQDSLWSNSHITPGKTIALTVWTFVGKVMSLLFNMLSRFIITFLPRSKRLLISCLQSPYAVILEPHKNKVYHCFHCFPIYLPWSDGTGCHDLRFLNIELFFFFTRVQLMEYFHNKHINLNTMEEKLQNITNLQSQLFHFPLSLSSRGSLVLCFLP